MDIHLNYKEVRWKNFKGYKDTGWIKIKPITIILGSNNAGKTSFLAPLLLMSQTINSRDRLSPLILKGDVYDGGNFQEIVKDYDVSKEIFFGYRYHIHETDEQLSPIGSYPPGGFEVTFKVEDKHSEIKLSKTTIFDIYKRRFLSLSLLKSGKYSYTGIGSKNMTVEEKAMIKNSEPTNFLFSTNTILTRIEARNEELAESNKRSSKGSIKRFSKGLSQFLSAISFNSSRTSKYLGDLSFIGPIRDNPHRIYEITNETYNTVGTKGENMPNLLRKIANDDGELNEWVKKFGFGDKLELKHHYSNSYSLRFLNDKNDYYTSIANAGFGASQVLPLLVQALVSPKRSITVAEQPEIHLNPRIQGVLAELFVSMAKKGQTIIAETHSEHLLLRLRRLIAEGQIESKDVAIYFVEKDGAESKIKEVSLQPNGHINPSDWPKDFLGDSLKESIALAMEQAKRRVK